MGVEGWYGEHLQLVAPLSLNKRSAPQWLQALERAMAYSLGSALAECHSSLPESLVGVNNIEQQRKITPMCVCMSVPPNCNNNVQMY